MGFSLYAVQDSFDSAAGNAGFMSFAYDLPTMIGLLSPIVLLLATPWFAKLGLSKRWCAKTRAHGVTGGRMLQLFTIGFTVTVDIIWE